MKKESNTKDKVMQSILFICLCIASIVLILYLWDFLYKLEQTIDSHRTSILFISCIIPVGLLYVAVAPWIKFEGFKGKVTGAQLMLLDDEGCYLGSLCDLDMEDVEKLAQIFNRESDYRYERFDYSSPAIYIQNEKGGQWFLPDKTDSRLFMTGNPGDINQLIGLKISEDESIIVDQIIRKYTVCNIENSGL